MDNLYLTNTVYENERNRIILYFSKNPFSTKSEYVEKEKFFPEINIDLPKDFLQKILSDFRKKINIEKIKENLCKITSKNYKILQQCAKILSLATSKNILLIEPERQFLIKRNWSYYDVFVQVNRNKINKIRDYDVTNKAIKEYLTNIDDFSKKKITPTITRRLMLSNLLKVKPEYNIKNDEILNILFENNFFENRLVLKNKSTIDFSKKNELIKNTINMDFSNIWAYLLQDDFYNISYETINCNCCKPKELFSTNTLSSSLVEVMFLNNGTYFLSKNKEWSRNYHKNNSCKENRDNYKKTNGLREYPVGPFFKNQKEQILLFDAVRLLEEKEITLTYNNNNNISWFCEKKESFVSKLIHFIKNKLNQIETSINLSTYANYSKNINSLELENNTNFIIYITQYKLLTDLLEEIPKFMLHRNTKFYDPEIEKAIKSIKLETINKINTDNCRLIEQTEKISTKSIGFVNKVNSYFIKINLPIPKLITN
ncbi:MAG: hypothetical protein PHR48_01285 [Candidatus ainarchaeum sp.]|nr:hypothetical protein [Candidatus ainarchaeum sp.]